MPFVVINHQLQLINENLNDWVNKLAGKEMTKLEHLEIVLETFQRTVREYGVSYRSCNLV